MFKSNSCLWSVGKVSLICVPDAKSDKPFFTVSTIHGISTFVSAEGWNSLVVDLVWRVDLLAGGTSDCMVWFLHNLLLVLSHAWVIEIRYPTTFLTEIALALNIIEVLLPHPFHFPRDNTLGMMKEIWWMRNNELVTTCALMHMLKF